MRTRPETSPPPPAFAAAIALFELALRAEGRSRTIAGYKTAARLFALFCANRAAAVTDPRNVSTTLVRAWIADLEESGRPSTAYTRHWQLRAFFRFCREEEIVDADPARLGRHHAGSECGTMPRSTLTVGTWSGAIERFLRDLCVDGSLRDQCIWLSASAP